MGLNVSVHNRFQQLLATRNRLRVKVVGQHALAKIVQSGRWRHTRRPQLRVRKMNVGTEFRQRYGQALRKTLANDPAIFDRTEIMLASVSSLRAMAVELLTASWHGDI